MSNQYKDHFLHWGEWGDFIPFKYSYSAQILTSRNQHVIEQQTPKFHPTVHPLDCTHACNPLTAQFGRMLEPLNGLDNLK